MMNGENDLVGGPYAVLESHPGVFTTLIQRLGVKELEVEEALSLDSWDVSHHSPRALIFCYHFEDDALPEQAAPDPDASSLWFAHQLSNDACATNTLLNTLLNCTDIHLGDELERFKRETEGFDSVMKGLAVSNMHFFRQVHNSVAAPSDIQAATHSLALGDYIKVKRRTKGKKRAKWSTSKRRKTTSEEDEYTPTYHYLGYVPNGGRVWEMDGISSGPVDVGQIDSANGETWLDVVRPALKLRMNLPHRTGDEEADIRFNLLAIVDSKYCKASDKLEAFKREKKTIERHLSELGVGDHELRGQVNKDVLALSVHAFEAIYPRSGTIFSATFASENMQRTLNILNTRDIESLIRRWELCVKNASVTREQLEHELEESKKVATQNAKRCHDYAPFIKEYVVALGREGFLQERLGL